MLVVFSRERACAQIQSAVCYFTSFIPRDDALCGSATVTDDSLLALESAGLLQASQRKEGRGFFYLFIFFTQSAAGSVRGSLSRCNIH